MCSLLSAASTKGFLGKVDKVRVKGSVDRQEVFTLAQGVSQGSFQPKKPYFLKSDIFVLYFLPYNILTL